MTELNIEFRGNGKFKFILKGAQNKKIHIISMMYNPNLNITDIKNPHPDVNRYLGGVINKYIYNLSIQDNSSGVLLLTYNLQTKNPLIIPYDEFELFEIKVSNFNGSDFNGNFLKQIENTEDGHFDIYDFEQKDVEGKINLSSINFIDTIVTKLPTQAPTQEPTQAPTQEPTTPVLLVEEERGEKPISIVKILGFSFLGVVIILGLIIYMKKNKNKEQEQEPEQELLDDQYYDEEDFGSEYYEEE